MANNDRWRLNLIFMCPVVVLWKIGMQALSVKRSLDIQLKTRKGERRGLKTEWEKSHLVYEWQTAFIHRPLYYLTISISIGPRIRGTTRII